MQLLVRSIVVALLLLVGTTPAHAGDPFAKPAAAEAREHLSKGNKLYSVRDFEKAIDEYKAGALVEQTPIFDYNLGQCYRQLGKYDDAIWHYERFRSRAQPTGDVLDAVNGFIASMKAELEKRAKTQPPIEAAPASLTNTSASGASRSSANTNGTTTLSTTSSATPVSRGPDWFGIGLVSAGSVGVLVGGGLLWNASSLRSDANKTADQTERDALYEKADTRTLVGGIVGGVGVAVLATGVIKLVIGRSSGDGTSSTSASWNVGASSSSFYVFGRF